MPKLVIMDQGGDMTKTWDEETRSQTEEIFNDLVRNQGYWTFIPDRSGNGGEYVKAFDPAADEIVLHRRLAGG